MIGLNAGIQDGDDDSLSSAPGSVCSYGLHSPRHISRFAGDSSAPEHRLDQLHRHHRRHGKHIGVARNEGYVASVEIFHLDADIGRRRSA
ncbi:MAG TPA: hypothetical protein PKA30_10850 [Accumulibacter sp.]|uniref:hypothetical protein n=1 Tax=Accumulibacter sp. TaxID=2053492 RepID=UPI00287982AF|nr:hypothetical protein [Accumulibacter sp.]MDS4014789.1 hypothetical protein [Accumulibacter sp.]HMV06034.1 hypothetical protein [Accumulibacter sp.]HMW64689.1 hypothetical protein [Accumulibacter sp.]HMX69616.1 hypothetical protein [Accumulibacter sp.]HNB69069.1 hypothetical protein [Accumulibacter sp.]